MLLPDVSLDQIIGAVNDNAAKIQSFQTNNATITAPGTGTPRLSGNIAVQRAKRLRLQASSLLGTEVDLGSNDELFWMWVRRNSEPGIYFARHEQFAGSAAQQMMPIEPQWLLDALGLAQFSPSDFHEGPRPQSDGTFEIRSVLRTAAGEVTKTTVVDAHAWILQQHVYDQQGGLLASALARSHRYYPEHGVSLPEKLDIQMPKAQLSLSIDLGSVAINQPAANPQIWEMPVIQGVPRVDLGSAPAVATQTFGNQLTRADWRAAPAPSAGTVPLAVVAPPSFIAAPVGGLTDSRTVNPTAPTIGRLPPGGVVTGSY